MRNYLFCLGLTLFACGPRAEAPRAPKEAAAPSTPPAPGAPGPTAKVPPRPGGNALVAARFDAHLAKHRDLSRTDLWKALGIGDVPDAPLSFDPSQAKYFQEVVRELQLTPEESELLRTRGMVSVDHRQNYSMGSAYFAIYTRDLPVLVTTDSILNAFHRSYDKIIQHLEVGLFTDTLERTLADAHEALGRRTRASAGAEAAIHDVDLYVTTARNLLAGQAASAEERALLERVKATVNFVPSRTGIDAEVKAVLGRVAAGRLEAPGDGSPLYGGERAVDYSQFAPRGHYTLSLELRRYFRALTWLGRADTGFFLDPPSAGSGIQMDAARERRNALLLTALLVEAKALTRLGAMTRIIDFLVGGADNLGPERVADAAAKRQLDLQADWSDEAVRALFDGLADEAAQAIRSQVIAAPTEAVEQTRPPGLFQLFGQRFLLDSFVLSQVVHDRILYRGQRVERVIPQGLDVMGALGSDEAVRLLGPELEAFPYGANLLAARRTVEELTETEWRSSTYASWLDAIRSLFTEQPESGHVPRVMRTEPWRRKMLQTGLASWAELRHDTLLYGKQSYGAHTLCEYPAGFVEPYPALYGKLRALAERAAALLESADVSHPDPARGAILATTRDSQVRFFHHFASIAAWLRKIAEKELAAEPLSAEDTAFLKRTIDVRGGGSGPPRYDGWYPSLIYGESPQDFKPTIADVHTYPGDRSPPAVVEVGTGAVTFLVAAIDNQEDHAIYVGPASTYYELTVPPEQRMTNEAWTERLATAAPPRPVWTASFQPPAKQRHLARQRVVPEDEPYTREGLEKAQKLSKDRHAIEAELRRTKDPKAAVRMRKELERLHDEIMRLHGACACPPGDDACPC